MNRLDFSLPEFTRIAWASERAKEVWKPRIDKISTLWPLIERWTVVAGIRSGALQSISPDSLTTLQMWCLENKQNFVVLAQEGSQSFYSNSSVTYDPSKPWSYRVYIGREPSAFVEAWKTQDNIQIASYLGYPVCCAVFFRKYWQKEEWRDLTYPMARFKSGLVEGSAMCNILLRHLGLRAVFHLPCSFDCVESNKIGENNFDAMLKLGYHKEADWLYQILNWPIEWSSLHGVAMVKTPVLKIVTKTDALPGIVTIERAGVEYPEEAIQPLQFVTKDNWSDNGFSSRAAMQGAHNLILDAIDKLYLVPGRVIDLGSGNGLLLEKIVEKYTLSPIGVEIDPERASKSKIPTLQVSITNPTIFDGKYELAIISINRFHELDDTEFETFVKNLKTQVNYIICYSYSKDVSVLPDWSHFDLVYAAKNEYAEVKILKGKVFTE